MRRIALALAAVLLAAPLTATVRFVKFDEPKVGTSGDVVAFDLAERKALWKVRVGKSANFVVETSIGVLVGNDEGQLVLLRPSDGKVVWSTELSREARFGVSRNQINHYHGESDEGFLVSTGDEKFWLASKQGLILMRW